jgi:predicted secreted protein
MRDILFVVVVSFFAMITCLNLGCGQVWPAKDTGTKEYKVLKTDHAPQEVKLTSSDHNGVFVVAQGGEIIVTLKENPSLKTKWALEPLPSFLTLKDESKKTYSETNQERRFIFKVKNEKATGLLTLLYKEAWKPDAPVLDIVSFVIEAR